MNSCPKIGDIISFTKKGLKSAYFQRNFPGNKFMMPILVTKFENLSNAFVMDENAFNKSKKYCKCWLLVGLAAEKTIYFAFFTKKDVVDNMFTIHNTAIDDNK